MTSRPPSTPTKKSPDWPFCAAILATASARCRAPCINSSLLVGVWLTPLSTSMPITSISFSGARSEPKEATASRTAPTFGLRVLPTTTRILFACEFIFRGGRDCTRARNEKTRRIPVPEENSWCKTRRWKIANSAPNLRSVSGTFEQLGLRFTFSELARHLVWRDNTVEAQVLMLCRGEIPWTKSGKDFVPRLAQKTVVLEKMENDVA